MSAGPERWADLDRVWHAVLARPASERAAAVEELCAADVQLRHDVESLLGHLARASAAGFGAAPDGSPEAASLIGREFGAYAVQARLGAGGMGEVFQARDRILDRDVALKMLPDRWLADADRQMRFDREARLLASLNHPNIGAIYGVQDCDTRRALVLELVHGETLADRLAARADAGSGRRGLPIADISDVARQILDALEAAHARGIVHRDLKPANVKITPEGRVKVLDFGLALAVSGGPDRPGSQASRLSQTTAVGMLAGTPPYMSPEQARGRDVDGRTDIWAFGCVLYELLTGVAAFRGDDLATVLATVVGGEPDWTLLPADTPGSVRLCLRRCLQKDPSDRFHHAADARLALLGAFEAAPGDAVPSRTIGRLERAGWLVLAAAAIVVTVIVGRSTSPAPAEVPRPAPPVLVSPQIGGGGSATATTIQEAIDMAARGATVSLLPGTYAETLVIRRGLTLRATGERTGPAVLAPATTEAAIEIATTEPVTITGLTVHTIGEHAILAIGRVDVTIARTTLIAVAPASGRNALIQIENDANASGGRARATLRNNLIDGGVAKLPPGVQRPQNHAVRLAGDVDAVVESNQVRRFGAICLVVDTRDDLGGQTNVAITNNDVDECHPAARVAAIKVGSPSVAVLSPTQPITATGVVDIVGNTIRNSSEDCVNNAIAYDVFTGRIERNRIIGFVKPCATATPRNLPGAIWLGLRPVGLTVPATAPAIRFNDIQGNAHAGVRVSSNQKIAADVSCNYWGTADGPSGIGGGSGDAIIVEPGGPSPRFAPFATAPIAQSSRSGC
jgi:hypothetical protein